MIYVCSFYVCILYVWMYLIKGSLGGETSVLRTFKMSGKEF